MNRIALPAFAAFAAALLVAMPACRSTSTPKPAPDAAAAAAKSALEVVHEFRGPIVTGVAVSRGGRVFVNFPRWGDPVQFTVGELRDGAVVPYPDLETNTPRGPEDLLSVQSVVVDAQDRLWALDTGSVEMKPIRGQQWPKLVGFDLKTDRRIATIHFPAEVALPTTYLNDVRFDLGRGAAGSAFVSDSSPQGPNGIIVVDLASGRSWRRLTGDPTVRGDPSFAGVVEGQLFMARPPGEAPSKPLVGVDGIAVVGDQLFYCPLASRQLHHVRIEDLLDANLSEAELARKVATEERAFASDGLAADAQGRLYLTDWEHNAVVLRTPEGRFETLVSDPRLLWPDSLALSHDNYLYVTANQLHRQPRFHEGHDLRVAPWILFRVRTVGQTKTP